MEYLLSKQKIDIALANNKAPRGKAVWIERVIPTLAKQLMDAPVRYRTYGIFWWEIKRLLNQRDYFFGDNQEGHIGDLYPEPYLYLAAGMISAIVRIAAGNFDNRYRYQEENGVQFDYVLEDRGVELRIASHEVKYFMLGALGGFNGKKK